MAGTVEGGKRAAKVLKDKYGDNYYKRIGAVGGRNGTTGGFFADRELARRAGAIGGARSRRGPAKSKAKIRKAHAEFQEGFELESVKLVKGWRRFIG